MTESEFRSLMKEAQRVFFEAMRVGYAGAGAPKTYLNVLPGATIIPWESKDGRWRVIDTYITTPHSDMSAGTTVIALEGKPLWFMQYHGRYQKEVIPFVKRCLLAAYEAEKFEGGRGLHGIREGIWLYTNSFSGTFLRFEGQDSVEDVRDEGPYLGHHWYYGETLIVPSEP